MFWLKWLKSCCLHRARSSTTKSHCGLRMSYEGSEIADKYLPWVKSTEVWSALSWRRIGWREFIFHVKSQPFQPDVPLWQKGELVYQISLSPSSTTGYSYSTTFTSVVFIHALCRQLSWLVCTILFISCICYSTISVFLRYLPMHMYYLCNLWVAFHSVLVMLYLILSHLFASCISLIVVKHVPYQAHIILNAFLEEYASDEEYWFCIFPSILYFVDVFGLSFKAFKRKFESSIHPPLVDILSVLTIGNKASTRCLCLLKA